MKKFRTAVAAVLVCAGVTVLAQAAAPSFTDVPQAHWAYSQVARAAQEGWVNGVGGGLFAPSAQVRGSEFTAMVVRAFYEDSVGASAPNTPWYQPYVDAAQRQGLLADGMNTPAVMEHPFSRYQMAVLLANVLENRGAAAAPDDVRADIADWDHIPAQYREAVALCYARGILTGVDAAGNYSGASGMTRAQAAVVLTRMADCLDALPAAPETPVTSTPEPVPAPAPEPEPDPMPAPPAAALSEESVRAAIESLRGEYPNGRPWTNDNSYFSASTGITGYGCVAFALICGDKAFGDLPISEVHFDFDRIRVGDMVRVNWDTHTVIVLEKRADSIVVAEGNINSAIYWGRELSRASLELTDFYVETRYPQ